MLQSDGKSGYILTDYNEETRYIARFSLDKPHELKPLHHVEGWDIEDLQLSPDERMLIFTVNAGGVSLLRTMDTHTLEINRLKGLPEGVISSLSWIDDSRCIFTLQTPVDPGDIWQVTLQEGQMERLTNFAHSVASVPLYEPELFHFASFDDLRVPYFYYDNNSGS